MNVLFVGAEVYPFSKVGGLADVLGSLPIYLAKEGINVKVITPGYLEVYKQGINLKKSGYHFNLHLGRKRRRVSISYYSYEKPELDIYFIENRDLFSSRGVYTDTDGTPYSDNTERFILLQKASLSFIDRICWSPDIVHCHDNHTALIPVYKRLRYAKNPIFKGSKTLLTIHNIGYQGVTSMDEKPIFGLPDSLFQPGGALEWHGYINPMKAGIIYSDAVSTVSKTHADELLTDDEISGGLRNVISENHKTVYGILNGVDFSEWSPEVDRFIYANYSSTDLSGKLKNKISLIKELRLDSNLIERPLFGMVSRLVEHKGIDLIVESINRIVAMNSGLVILGSGDEKYHRLLNTASKRFKGKIYVEFGMNNTLAHKIIAGCDIFLMPSRYEPCGITQMYALKYGTIPIVRKTGGLADTVINWENSEGNGFLFNDYNAEELIRTIALSIQIFKMKDEWNRLVYNSMKLDFSWERAAKQYIELYEKVLLG